MSEKPESEALGLEGWDAAEPPPGFADAVMARIEREDAQKVTSIEARSRRPWLIGGAVSTVSVAAALLLWMRGGAHDGDITATQRTEVAIGSRAIAVLEPGAHVRWHGDDVDQASGEGFYRVNPGGEFHVNTSAARVDVTGTCFAVKLRASSKETPDEKDDAMNKRDVKSALVGASAMTLARVAVYEGKVVVSHAGERVDVGPGEAAHAGPNGLGERNALAEAEAEAESEDALAVANQSLVAQVGEYRRRLEDVASKKIELEQTLKNAETKLVLQEGKKSAQERSDFDIDQDGWKELAKEGTMKFMTPCQRPSTWNPPPELMQKLALAPDDAATLK